MNNQYRKKPVVIEAFKLGHDNMPDWFTDRLTANEVTIHNTDGRWRGGPDYALIKTLEGFAVAKFGDWIIRGMKGELYPCKPDIFAATYESAATVAEPNESYRHVAGPSVPQIDKILQTGGYVTHDQAFKAAQQQAEPVADEREAWEYSFIHSSATGRPDEKVGPCLTYDKDQAFGVGCIEQRAVRVGAAQSGQRAGVAEGYVLVPKEPTPEMVKAFKTGLRKARAGTLDALRDAIAAAPTQQQEGGHDRS